jgi:putative FmdB family regulatory protein
MPLYEYQCEACGHRFEIIQKFSDPPLATCERCGGTLRKLLSSPAIQFKGSGWYITDYARAAKTDTASPAKSDGDSPSAETKSYAKGEKKSESKGESKSETKGDTKPSSSPPSTS